MTAPASPVLPSLHERTAAWPTALSARLAAKHPELWRAFPSNPRKAVIATGGPGYGRLPDEIHKQLQAIAALPNTTDLFARCWLTALLEDAGTEHAPIGLPPSVTALHAAEHRRILAALEDENRPVDLSTDRWKKNYAILTYQLIPVGAEFANPDSGIPRSMLMRGGLAQQLQALRTVTTETGGFRPLLELHAHPDSLDDFPPKGWRASYHRLAEILQINPAYKGVMASSWFRDPALKTISPKLGYLRDYPMQYGARMFMTVLDTAGTSGALARSPTRRRLFREGAYVPRIYMMIWPRRAILRWHQDNH